MCLGKSRNCNVVILLILVGGWFRLSLPNACAQTNEEDHARGRGVAQDPSGRRPPLPDDPNEGDVAKRRTFIHELNYERINFGCFQYPDMLREALDDTAQERKATLLDRWATLLAANLRKCFKSPDCADRGVWNGSHTHPT